MSTEKLYLRDIPNYKDIMQFDDIYTNMVSSGLWFVKDEDEDTETKDILSFSNEYWYTYNEEEYEWHEEFAEAVTLYEERQYYIDVLYHPNGKFEPSEYQDWNSNLKYWKKAMEFYDWCSKKGEDYFELLDSVDGNLFDKIAFIDEKMR